MYIKLQMNLTIDLQIAVCMEKACKPEIYVFRKYNLKFNKVIKQVPKRIRAFW